MNTNHFENQGKIIDGIRLELANVVCHPSPLQEKKAKAYLILQLVPGGLREIQKGMNRPLVIVAEVVALIGLLVDLIYVYDQAYGIHHTGSLAPDVPYINIVLFALTSILVFVSAFVGEKKVPASMFSSSTSSAMQLKS
jgi:hypothetical protein